MEPAVDRMGEDDWRCVMDHVLPDNQLAARLAFTKMSRAASKQLPGFRAGVRTQTRVVSTLRSEALREWAASVGSPSPFPHWVELHSLARASYNGRIGRALGPPNDKGRVPVQLDGGLGELEPASKPIALRPDNLHPLVCLDTELVYAVRLKSGSIGPGNWSEVSVPRRHSCFAREQHTNQLSGFGYDELGVTNSLNWSLAFKTTDELMAAQGTTGELFPEGRLFFTRYMNTISGLTTGPPDGPSRQLSRHTILSGKPLSAVNAEPIAGARWALVQRPPLLAACGVNLALQRVSRPHSLDRMAMTNQPACFLMLDPHTGFAPPNQMDGIGDAYVYQAKSSGPAAHFRLRDFEHIWDWVMGDLGAGEGLGPEGGYTLSEQAFAKSRQRFFKSRAREAEGESNVAGSFFEQFESCD